MMQMLLTILLLTLLLLLVRVMELMELVHDAWLCSRCVCKSWSQRWFLTLICD